MMHGSGHGSNPPWIRDVLDVVVIATFWPPLKSGTSKFQFRSRQVVGATRFGRDLGLAKSDFRPIGRIFALPKIDLLTNFL